MADPDKKKARLAAQQVKQKKKIVKQGERYIKKGKKLDKKAGGMIGRDTKTRTKKAAKVESSRNFERAGKHQVKTGTKAQIQTADGKVKTAKRSNLKQTPKQYNKSVYAATGHSTPGKANLGRSRR